MKRPTLLKLIFIVITVAIVITYNNCSPSHVGQGASNFSCEAFLKDAFENSFYKWMRNKEGKKCSSCHVLGGGEGGVGPGQFADENFELAFKSFSTRISIIEHHAKSAHQGAGLDDPISPLINGFIADYNVAQDKYTACLRGEGEELLSAQTEEKTMGLTIQNNPKDIIYKIIDFDLETELAKGTIIPGALISIEVAYVQVDEDYKLYYFRKPRASTTTSPISLKNLYISINGVLQTSLSTWKFLEQSIPADTNDFLLSEATTFIFREGGGPKDRLSLSFGDLTKIVPSTPNDPNDPNDPNEPSIPEVPEMPGNCAALLEEAFRNGFYEWMRNKEGIRCSNCHIAGGGPPPFADADFQVAFSTFRTRVDFIEQRAKSSHKGAGLNDPNSPLINGFREAYDKAIEDYDTCLENSL